MLFHQKYDKDLLFGYTWPNRKLYKIYSNKLKAIIYQTKVYFCGQYTYGEEKRVYFIGG
jgi:hypothetical protein